MSFSKNDGRSWSQSASFNEDPYDYALDPLEQMDLIPNEVKVNWRRNQGISYSDTKLALAEGKGFEGSTALAVTLTAGSHANRGLYLYANADNRIPQEYPNVDYLRVWVDFTDIDFRKACFGAVTKYGDLYSTDDLDGRSNLLFYYLAEGSTKWKRMTHGSDGCFGDAQSSSVKNFRGWLAFPTSDFARRGNAAELLDSREIKAVYMYFDLLADSMLGKPFYLDEIAFVADYTVFEEVTPAS